MISPFSPVLGVAQNRSKKQPDAHLFKPRLWEPPLPGPHKPPPEGTSSISVKWYRIIRGLQLDFILHEQLLHLRLSLSNADGLLCTLRCKNFVKTVLQHVLNLPRHLSPRASGERFLLILWELSVTTVLVYDWRQKCHSEHWQNRFLKSWLFLGSRVSSCLLRRDFFIMTLPRLGRKHI